MQTISPQLDTAIEYHRHGDLLAAAKGYRQILMQNPRDAAALRMVALLSYQYGRHAEALNFIDRSLAFESDSAESHRIRGHICLAAWRYQEAAASYQHALRLEPADRASHINLGLARLSDVKPEEALACFRETLERWPTDVVALTHLGITLLQLGRTEEAVESLRTALRYDPESARAHDQLGIALRQLGEAQTGAAHHEQALQFDRHCVTAYFNLSQAEREGDYSFGDRRLNELRAIAEEGAALAAGTDSPARDADGGTLVPDAHAGRLPVNWQSEINRAHYALGNVFDARGRYDEAFHHFRLANQLQHAQFAQIGQPFKPDEQRRIVSDVISGFGAQYFAKTRDYGIDSETPIFVVGMPRSGKSLVERLLATHPAVQGVGERREIVRAIAELPRKPSADATLVTAGMSEAAEFDETPGQKKRYVDPRTIRSLAARQLQRLQDLSGHASRVIETMPDNVFCLGFIATLFPRARVIFCRRDPLDVCLTCYFSRFKWLRYTTRFEDLACYYRELERLVAHWQSVLPLRWRSIHFENLITDPAQVRQDLLEFCGLHDAPASLTVDEFPVRPNLLFAPQNYARHTAPLKRALGT